MTLAAAPTTYAGDVSVHDAWGILQENESAVLLDVRTDQEWRFVGRPDISSLNKETLYISWRILPDMQVNGGFESEVMELQPDASAPMLFLCKAGGRSLEAAIAMAKRGYTHCYNIAGGFEDPGIGWKINNLPWMK